MDKPKISSMLLCNEIALHLQNVLPIKAYQWISGPPVRELYVNEESKNKLLERINSFPKVQLTKIDLEWLQVSFFYFYH